MKKNNIKIKSRLFLLLIWIIAIILILLFLPWRDLEKERVTANIVEIPVIKYINYFSEVNIEADIAAVWDIKNQRFLYRKNINKQVPLASLTKVMTALIASQYLKDDDIIKFDQRATILDDSLFLPVNSQWLAKDLIDLTLVKSSNAGSKAIALAVEDKTKKNFSSLMNKQAKKLNMESYFINESGLDIGGGSYGGSYGSAQDMIKLFEYIFEENPELLEATKEEIISRKSLTGQIITAINTHEDINKIDGILASKTGFTGQAGGNLGIIFNAELDSPVIIIVLSSTKNQRFSDILKLVEASRKQIKDGY